MVQMTYKIREQEGYTNPILTLLEGEYAGIGVMVNKVRFEESPESDECKMLIDYEIVDPIEKYDSDFLISSIQWMNTLGDLCVQILEARVNESKSTGNDPQKSSSE